MYICTDVYIYMYITCIHRLYIYVYIMYTHSHTNIYMTHDFEQKFLAYLCSLWTHITLGCSVVILLTTAHSVQQHRVVWALHLFTKMCVCVSICMLCLCGIKRHDGQTMGSNCMHLCFKKKFTRNQGCAQKNYT